MPRHYRPQVLINPREYIKITVDYPMEAAHEFSKLSDHLRFIYVSGMAL